MKHSKRRAFYRPPADFCGENKGEDKELAVLDDGGRKAILEAFNEHFLDEEPLGTFELWMRPPSIWRNPAALAEENLQFILERIEGRSLKGRGIALGVGREVTNSNFLRADFDLATGQVYEIAFFDRSGNARLSFQDGVLVSGERWIEMLARQRVDQFLIDMCKATGLAQPPRSPI